MQKIDFTGKPGEYTYEQGPNGKHAYGVVQTGATSERDPVAQRTAGGLDREPGDHGGHLIAHSLGGRNDPTNLDPQNANVNQIGQRGVERQVTQAAQDPNNTVFMDVQNYNSNGSQRPDATMITVAVENHATGNIDVQHHSFQNASYEEQAQWDAIANEISEVDPTQDAGMTAEERALANEYADVWYDEPDLGSGHTTFFDQDVEPISSIGSNALEDESVSDSPDNSISDDDSGISISDDGLSMD